MLEIPALWMFPALFTLVFLGIPVAFSMIGLSFAFGYWFFGDTLGQQMFSRLQDVSQNYVLTALPLFIFMGAALERSGIAERLFYALQLWIGRLRGGLGLTSISMCGIFAACSGVVGAVETVVGNDGDPADDEVPLQARPHRRHHLRRRLPRHHHPADRGGRRLRLHRRGIDRGSVCRRHHPRIH